LEKFICSSQILSLEDKYFYYMESIYPQGNIFILRGQIFILYGKYLSFRENIYP
jgi:hypothetical protein